MKSKTIVKWALATLLATPSAHALPSYVSLVPNGAVFSCATCHTAPPTLNPFGMAFEENNLTWNALFASRDSDGDGFSNGTELGDPTGSGTPTPGATVTNPGDSTSHPPSASGPTITTQPASQTVTVGANVTFTVVATGEAPLGYQWAKGGTAIAGATTATLTLNAVTTADAGTYTVTVSDAAGSVTSDGAVLTVNSVPGENQPPTVQIITPRDGATFPNRAHIAFTATASDSDGTIQSVEFFAGTQSLGKAKLVSGGEDEDENEAEATEAEHDDDEGGSASGSYYVLVADPLPAGSYVITAVATDNQGAMTISEPVHLNIRAVGARRGHAERFANRHH